MSSIVPTTIEADTSRLPAFIEADPDRFKPVHDCTASELRAEAAARVLRAREALGEAVALDQLAAERE